MSLQHIQYHPCPCCGSEARLVTDIEEKRPQKDKQGNRLYRCIRCNITIAVDMYGKIKKKR